jgi:threonine dehydrogenase-like Zn-dependent dehydrogenase
VAWPSVPAQAALIKVGACGVCGTDQHILKGHWPKPLPWPFTLGHEIGGVIVEKGKDLTEDFMGKPIDVGSKVMIPPLMPCGRCYYCLHYPENANKCLTPVYYGRYLAFEKPPHLWGGFAEYVYVDLEMLPGTKIYKLPDDMSLRLGSLSEPLTSCIRAFNRAARAGGFKWGDTAVIQGSGPIGILAVAAAQEMGAGRVICVGAPENPRLRLARKFGAEATVDIEEITSSTERVARVREIVGGFGADLVMDCSGHPSAGPEGIEMLRDGGTFSRWASSRTPARSKPIGTAYAPKISTCSVRGPSPAMTCRSASTCFIALVIGVRGSICRRFIRSPKPASKPPSPTPWRCAP